jgi:sodium/pantothenate symporter
MKLRLKQNSVLIAEALKKWAGVSFPFWFSPPIIGAVASFLCIWVGSSLTQVTEEERIYRESLFIIPAEEYDSKEIEVTKRYPKIIVSIGVLTILVLIYFYVIPYGMKIGS